MMAKPAHFKVSPCGETLGRATGRALPSSVRRQHTAEVQRRAIAPQTPPRKISPFVGTPAI